MGNETSVSPAQFQEFLEAELSSIRGLWYPVRPLLLTRLLVRHARVNKLHPNPDDEFCDPKIGPHYGIIAKYEREMRRDGLDTIGSAETEEAGSSLGEPLEVQKIRPDGYMILNGHHRWAATTAGSPSTWKKRCSTPPRAMKTALKNPCPFFSGGPSRRRSAGASRPCSVSWLRTGTTSGYIPPGIILWTGSACSLPAIPAPSSA